MQQAQMVQAVGAVATALRRFAGTVKNWNPEKGWGFITCQETMNIYGKDIFLHKKELSGQVPNAGAPVQFSVGVDNGKPIATSVALNMNGGYRPATVPPS